MKTHSTRCAASHWRNNINRAGRPALAGANQIVHHLIMLIFDNFKNLEVADDFAIHVRDSFGRAARVCSSRDEFDKHELFPFELQPPMVLVERDKTDCDPSSKLESKIEALVEEFEGRFAGT